MSENVTPTDDLVSINLFPWLEAMEQRTSGQRYLKYPPEFDLFRKGLSIALDLLHYLGESEPKDADEGVQRDLACDTIDSLRCAERVLLCGYENQCLALLRRAYETISLMAYFTNFPSEISGWEKGESIKQSHIRQKLDTAPVPEPKDHLKEIYKIYSLFTHINRATVYHRHLGDPNRFTIGAQGNVDDKAVEAILRELLRLTMWFVDVMNYAFARVAKTLDEQYKRVVLGYRDEVERAARRLHPLL